MFASVWGEKYPKGFLYTQGKINCGRASVYRKYTINKDTGTQALFIFYKIQIQIPVYVRSIACRWADLTWAIVVFWLPGPRKAPG
jgi:hypothetical protein